MAGMSRGMVRHAARGRLRRRRVAGLGAGGVVAVAMLASLLSGVAGISGAPASAGRVRALGYDPTNSGSLSSITQMVGAQSAWAAGYTGAGVDVAVIDTGVAAVPGLDAPGKVINGPDLSFDSPNGWPAGVDGYGHGTFMAGLVAGRDAGASASAQGCSTCLNASGYSDTTKFVGVAPDARIVNVKVGAADGAVDVTQVIAAIDWVVQHAHDPGLNIRVISLSYGTDSTQNYRKDPLAQAAEQAWAHGIVVVAAAGNDGKTVKRLADPGYDPFVLAVGGDNPKRTLTPSDDVVPHWAQHGNANRPVDLIAPALHVIGLRVPGSFVDTLPDNTGQVGARFQRGSGTSQATAIVAGVAALVLQAHPDASPDQVKALLNGTATSLSTPEAIAAGQRVHWGNGLVNAAAAVTATPGSLAVTAQTASSSTGRGTLDATRAGAGVSSGGVVLSGQRDIFGRPFDSRAMAAQQAAAKAWTGGVWNGSRWTGDNWTGDNWTGSRWTGRRWTGDDWSGSRWTGSRWTDKTWNGSRWTGDDWNGSRWTDHGWDESHWAEYDWN